MEEEVRRSGDKMGGVELWGGARVSKNVGAGEMEELVDCS